MKLFGLSETKSFHFHVIIKETEIDSAKRIPYIYTYEPYFQKSLIRPYSCLSEHQECQTGALAVNHSLR